MSPALLWIVAQSTGGLLTPDHASGEHAARTALSGLAGGVVGSAMWADQLGLDKAVSFDIGGTSTDIALIRDGQPDETMAGQIDELPLQLPSVDVHTIGAGGGSIAWLDSGGGLRVGPHSAGAEPGPVCYRRGGLDLTVTDAHAVLGRLGSSLLGGRFELDLAAARQRMTEWGDSPASPLKTLLKEFFESSMQRWLEAFVRSASNVALMCAIALSSPSEAQAPSTEVTCYGNST